MKIDLKNYQIEHRDSFIFFASHDFMIYKEGRHIIMSDCQDEIIASVKCPNSFRNYEYFETPDRVVFVFGGKDLLCFMKDDGRVISVDLPVTKIGRIFSEIFPLSNGDSFIAAATLHEKIHFINFDYLTQTRIFQTASWSFSAVADVCSVPGKIYVLLDKTYLVCFETNTGEVLWTRFETGVVQKKILLHKDDLLYTCDNLLKIVSLTGVNTIRIPLARPDTLEYVFGNSLIYTSNNKKHVCCFDLKKKELMWEITGSDEIEKTLPFVGVDGAKESEMMLVKTKNNMALINLESGYIFSQLKMNVGFDVRKTGDHILIHKPAFRTDFLAGIKND